MNTTVRRKKTEPNSWLRGLLFLTTATGSVQAENFMKSEGLFNALTGRNVNKTQFMQFLRTSIGGWLEGGYTFNPDDPRDGHNGPLTFDNQANKPVLDELYLFFDRPAKIEKDRWGFGWRADFLYGTDSPFTQAFGLDKHILGNDTSRFYKVAIPQLYVETFIPFGKGITVKLGHFYTIIGNETVTAPDNFFYTHAYTMQYGEPFTHTGFLASSPITHNISVDAGGVLGWNNFSANPENLDFLGRVSWNSDDERTSLAAAIITGDVTKVPGPGNPNRNRTMYSTVFNHDITERLHYTLQHDFGTEQNAVANNKPAQWFGINQYLFFRINEALSTGLRFEWFRDTEGIRVIVNGLSGPANYFAVTAGVNWKLLKWVTFRPEVRYDWMDSSNGFKAFDNNSKTNQFVIAGDLIIQF